LSPRVLIVHGSVTEIKAEHSRNIASPRFVMVDGIITFVRETRPLKA